MKNLIIKPNKSIGQIKFGMTRNEINNLLNDEKKISSQNNDINFFWYEDYIYLIGYKRNKVIEINIMDKALYKYNVLLDGIDLFKNKVEDIIPYLKSKYELSFDGEDEDLSTLYEFTSLGISLWRESSFHSKLLNSKDFKLLSVENQEYEKKFLFFNSINLTKKI